MQRAELESLVRSWNERAETAEGLAAAGVLGRAHVEARQAARTYRTCAIELNQLLTMAPEMREG